jgi:hypothetical protein
VEHGVLLLIACKHIVINYLHTIKRRKKGKEGIDGREEQELVKGREGSEVL